MNKTKESQSSASVIEAEIVESKPQTYDIAILNNKVDIVSRVDEIAADVERRIAELNLDKIEATEENKKKITAMRTALNAELNQYAADIKAINKIINEPLDLLKSQVKTKIEVLYKSKIEMLKEKLEAITREQAKPNEDYAATYFANKKKSVNIRIDVKYEDIPWTFGFNSSKKSIRDTCDAYFEKIQQGLVIVDNHEYKEQLEALWIKEKYDIGQALLALQTQINLANQILKQKEAKLIAEQERLEKQLEEQKRIEAAQAQIKAEAEAAVTSGPPVVEVLTEYSLKVEVTEKQLERLVSFLVDEDIEFELNE